jgi:hypothetical protein
MLRDFLPKEILERLIVERDIRHRNADERDAAARCGEHHRRVAACRS